MQDLLDRRDGPGVVRFATQFVLFAAAACATFALASAGHAAWLGTAMIGGLVLPGFFAAMHEAAHRTAFRSRALNELALLIGSLLMLQVPSFFREFHFEHHRSTQDREKDPELSLAPELMDPWPRSLGHYLLLVSGQTLMVGKLAMTLACALPGAWRWDRLFPYVRRDRRRRVAWESRGFAVLLVALAYAAASNAAAAAVLVSWPVAHLLLGLFLMPEHTGLPSQGSQLERTRSIPSHALVHWWMWNMPLHAEHHAYPAVPFHALPVLHARLRGKLVHVSEGYLRFHREALARAVHASRW